MSRQRSSAQAWVIGAGVLVIALVLCLCVFAVALLRDTSTTVTQEIIPSPTQDPRSATLTLATSPEKAELVRELVRRFNDQGLRTSDRQPMEVQLLELTPEAMVEEALREPRFQAMTPDSSLWVDQLDRRWAELQQLGEGAIAPSLAGESVRYAVSPVVIAHNVRATKETTRCQSRK